MSLPRHSIVAMFSLATEVEEPKIEALKGFRTAFTELAGIRALVLPNTPLMACTAMATPSIRKEVASTLEMIEYVTIFMSPNCPNKKYHTRRKSNIGNDFSRLLSTHTLVLTPGVIFYCNTLLTCAELFYYFSYAMGISQ